MRRTARRLAALLAAALLGVAQPAAAAPTDLASDLLALRALDTRVQTAGWRLAQGNAAFCRERAPGVGLQVFDAAGFGDPAAVRGALGLSGDIAIAAVAADGPAARAGLTAGTDLRALAGEAVAALPPVKPGDYARLAALHDRVDGELLATGRLRLAGADGREMTIVGEPACLTRFEMLTSGSRASADGKRVVIGRKLVEALPDDLLAAALAHELAHNLLAHRARLDAEGRSWSKVKRTEREADRLAPWLLANAGYDPRAMARFFEVWGPKYDLGILATPDHDGWKDRAKRVAAESLRVEAARGPDGRADWRAAFPPDEPAKPLP